MASLLRRPQILRQGTARTFSTTTAQRANLQWEKNNPESLAEKLPPYPYGPAQWYKQSRLGLYGGQRIQFGNNVSDRYKVKTRRSWLPNIKVKRLFSHALNRHVQVRVSTRVLRTIDKLGGLDQYLLGEKEARIKELGESGWWLRWAIMQTPAVKKRFAAERTQLGLAPDHGEIESTQAEAAVQVAADVEAEAEFAGEPSVETVGEEASAAAEALKTADAAEAMEELSSDDAFVIEQPAGLPPLKFRVGQGKHIFLTDRGWRRTREDPARRIGLAKDRIRKRYQNKYLDGWMAEAEKKLGGSAEDVKTQDMLKLARKQYMREINNMVEATWAQRMAVKELKQGQRDVEKMQRKASDQAVQMVEAEAAV